MQVVQVEGDLFGLGFSSFQIFPFTKEVFRCRNFLQDSVDPMPVWLHFDVGSYSGLGWLSKMYHMYVDTKISAKQAGFKGRKQISKLLTGKTKNDQISPMFYFNSHSAWIPRGVASSWP